MWCYQKPGFEALLVAELQRQQHHRQFCDTLLRAEGVSVPAHSCVLSAISPQLSTALASSPAPPAGREHLVEFGTVGASSLLHVVRLLYSGEMAGEGESEKQEAVSAAAKLGILGLVEVTRRKWRDSMGTEVGVQTDPVELNEKEVTCWRRGVSDGSAILCKETLSSGKKDALTETEEVQASSAPSCQSVPAYKTIDMALFESLGQADNHVVLQNVQTPPICLQDEAQNCSTSSVVEHPDIPWMANSQSCLFSNTQAEASILDDGRAEDEQFEQFLDDIPGFISHFLNVDSEEVLHTGRAKRRQSGRPRQRGGAVRPARRPQARRGRRGRGGWTQTVDVQEVRVSRQHKSLLQRCGMATSVRTGQGGGATGRKLHLMTRHVLGLPWSLQRRRRWPDVWDFWPSGQSHSWMGGGDKVKRGRRNDTPQHTQVSHPAPHPAPPPHVDAPEHFDHLFEEVMRNMEVKLSSSTPHSQPPPAAKMCSCSIASCGGDTDLPACSCIPGFTEIVTTGRTNGEAVHLDPLAEGDLTDLLEDFLQSLEQHSGNCVSRETQEEQDGSRFPHLQRAQEDTTSSHSNTRRETSLNTTRRVKAARKPRRKKWHPVQGKEWIHEAVRDVITQLEDGRGDKRLRCTAVVELNRRNALHPVSCQAVKNPALSKTGSSSRHQQVSVIRKTYPIRSRFKAIQITDQPHPEEPPRQLGQPGRPKKKTQLPCESDSDSSPEVDRCENNVTEEEAPRSAPKRQAQPEEETRDFGSEAKRKHLEPNVPLPVKWSDETSMLARTGDETSVVKHHKELDNMNAEVSLGTGSEEVEEDIDVIGALGTIPDLVTVAWSLSSQSEEEEEADEEIDIIGEADFFTSGLHCEQFCGQDVSC